MNKQKRDELRALANAATPGPWKYDCGNGEIESEHPQCHRRGIVDRQDLEERLRQAEEFEHALPLNGPHQDLDYIAAVNPITVKALLDALDKADKRKGISMLLAAIIGWGLFVAVSLITIPLCLRERKVADWFDKTLEYTSMQLFYYRDSIPEFKSSDEARLWIERSMVVSMLEERNRYE